MQSNLSLSIATTTSGMIGGVSKAVSEQLTIASISTQGIIDVAFYAVISATVGYFVKIAFDSAMRKLKSKKQSK